MAVYTSYMSTAGIQKAVAKEIILADVAITAQKGSFGNIESA